MDALKVNMLVSPFGGAPPIKKQARIARIDPERKVVWLSFPGTSRIPRPFDLPRFNRWFEDERVIPVPDRPIATVLASDQASDRTQELCDEAYERIRPIVDDLDGFFDEGKRATIVRAAAKEAGVDLATMYRTISRYFENGQTKLALMPRYRCKDAGNNQPEGQKRRGRPPREKPPEGEQAFVFTDESRDKIIDLLMSSERFATFEALYGQVTYDLYTEEVNGERALLPLHRVPTRSQIRHLVRQIDKGFAFTRRQLGNEYNLTIRPIDGGGRSLTFGPGYEYQIDATGTQVEIVSVFDRNRVIGRATLYLVIDVSTTAIVGFHVCLKPPSWESARFALFHAFSPKADFCRRIGLSIDEKEWPISGLPVRIIGDRGELIGEQAERLVEDTLNCDLINARTRRGDDKAYVERAFRTFKKGLMESLPGWGPKNRARNGINPRTRACLNLYEINQLVARYILHWNHKKLAVDAIPDTILGEASARATPMGLWEWGLKNQSGRLRHIENELLYRHLLPQKDATMHADGIHFLGDVYRSPEIDALGFRTRARRNGAFDVKVHYDSARADHIWLWLEKQRRLIECTRVDASGDRDRWFFADSEVARPAKVQKRAKEATQTEKLRTQVEHARIAIAAAAKAEKKATQGKPQSVSKQSVRRNRSEELPFDEERIRANAGDPRRMSRGKSGKTVPTKPNRGRERFLSASAA